MTALTTKAIATTLSSSFSSSTPAATTVLSQQQQHIQNAWRFLTHTLHSPKYIMAPMVDQSELAFRQLCRKYNTHLCYTPMINARSFVMHINTRLKDFSTCMGNFPDRPLIAQFGSNEKEIVVTAAKLIEKHVDAVDLNLGCPQGFARKQKIGAWLLEDTNLICEMVKNLSSNIDIPVTCKIRLVPGELERSIELALRLQDAGCSLLAVHGRYRTQIKDRVGASSWLAIHAIKQHLAIPVFANGGVETLADVEEALKETKADGMMVSEGLLSDPKLFVGGCKSIQERLDIAVEYLQHAHTYNSTRSQIRGHLFKMLYPLLFFPFDDLRPLLGLITDPADIIPRIRENLLKCNEDQLALLWKHDSWYHRDLERLNANLQHLDSGFMEKRESWKEQILANYRLQQKQAPIYHKEGHSS